MSQTLVFTIFAILAVGMIVDALLWLWKRTLGKFFKPAPRQRHSLGGNLDPTACLKLAKDRRAWQTKQHAKRIKCPSCQGWAVPVWGSETRFRCEQCSKIFQHSPDDTGGPQSMAS